MRHFPFTTARSLKIAALTTIVSFGSIGALLAEEGKAAEGGLNPLAFQTDLALWTGIVFLGLVFVLGKFAFRPIANALDAREKTMFDKVAAADKANADAKDLLATYQQKLKDSEAEVHQMIENAKADAKKSAETIVADAKAKADAEHERAMKEIASATDSALSDLAAKSASLATNLAGKILHEKITPADHARLIEGAINEFSKN